MPTAGRVTAAILYAGLAFYVSLLVREIFLDERPLPTLPYWNAFFGVILGWRLAGARAGGGLSAAIGYGITTTIALFITCLFFNCFAEMIRRSMRNQYDGPAEAAFSVAEIMLTFGQRVATGEIVAIMVVGGLAAAMLTELAGRG